MIIEKTGDLFDSDAPVIGHGCNCEGVMGKGIAVVFKYNYPKMYRNYHEKCKEGFWVPGDVYLYKGEDRYIANMMTQDKKGPNARYEWIIEALGNTLDLMETLELDRIGIPRVGTGIGGLSWRDMYYELVSNFEESPIEIEVWSL